MERPFDALVDMDDPTRALIADHLAVDLANSIARAYAQAVKELRSMPAQITPLVPDSLAESEAVMIIGQNGRGIQARAHSTARTISPLARNFTWREVLLSIIRERRIRSKQPADTLTEEQLEAAIFQHIADQVQNGLQPADREKLLRRWLAWIDSTVPVDASVLRQLLALGVKKALAGGFKTYIRVVQVAGWLNRRAATKLVMSRVTWATKKVLSGLGFILLAHMVIDVLSLLFGPSRQRLLAVVALIHQHYLLKLVPGPGRA
jgi:hypothetical protein